MKRNDLTDPTSKKTPRKSTGNRPRFKPRPYTQSGYYALETALEAVARGDTWLEELGELAGPLKAWQDELVDALGGRDQLSPQQRALVEMVTREDLVLASVDRFILSMPSYVNKSRRQLFPILHERARLADSLAKRLQLLGLERREKPVPSLQEYLESKDRDAHEHDP